jgi:hypothetical protein
MFRSFIAWLDLYISRETPASVLKGLIGLMAFAGLLGTIFGNHVIRVGAFVIVILFIVSVILLLLADRRHLQLHYDTTHKLLTRYCDFLACNSSEPLVSVQEWRQVVYIEPDGDVREVITIKAVALRERVYFIRMTAGSKWDQPERYRRTVKVIARGLTVNNRAGPRWSVTTTWASSERMIAILHLHEPIKQGEEILFEVVRIWPAKCRPLMRDKVPDSFTFRTTRLLDIQHVDYKIVLPSGFHAVHEPIGHLSVEDDHDEEGRQVFRWEANVPDGETVGVRLELSGSQPEP